MKKIEKLINELASNISYFESNNSKVSNATVGWQIEHSLKTIELITTAINNSNPVAYKWKFNKIRFMIYLKDSFPRGKAKAPRTVQPSEDISIKSLQENIIRVRSKLVELNEANKNAYFSHPYFGDLNKKTSIWFLGLHTNHHLKIINDILKK